MEFSIKKLKYKLESNIFCTELENTRIAKVKILIKMIMV